MMGPAPIPTSSDMANVMELLKVIQAPDKVKAMAEQLAGDIDELKTLREEANASDSRLAKLDFELAKKCADLKEKEKELSVKEADLDAKIKFYIDTNQSLQMKERELDIRDQQALKISEKMSEELKAHENSLLEREDRLKIDCIKVESLRVDLEGRLAKLRSIIS